MIIAEYHQECARCGEDVYGKEICWFGVDDDLVHVKCPPPPKPQPTCPRCYLQHAGECF